MTNLLHSLRQLFTASLAGHSRLTVGGIRRSFFYQPLAVLLVVLMLPALSWRSGAAAGPFEAAAQTIVSCATDTSNNTNIIRNYCNPAGSVAYFTDLSQLESDAVNAYMAMNSLPASQASLVYTYGRKDTRSAIRALMLATMLGIAQKQASARTPHEQSLYDWYSSWVQANEISLFQNALSHFNQLMSDPCHFSLDRDLATSYKLEFDGTAFCFGGTSSFFSTGPNIPSVDYFTAYGLRKSYGAAADQYPDFAEIVTKTSLNLALAAGVGVAVGAIIVAVAGSVLGASFAASFAVFSAIGVSTFASSAVASATFVISGAGVAAIGGVAVAVAGVLAIVLIAVAIGVAAGIQVFNNQANIDAVNGLNSDLTNARNTPPDLNAFSTDTAGKGMFKLVTTFVARTLPDRASTAVLPVHRSGQDNDFLISNATSPTLSYQDWDGNVWTASTYGGWLAQTCSPKPGKDANGNSYKCGQNDTFGNYIQYVDDNNTKWMAIRFGDKFVSTKLSPDGTDTGCPANAVSKVSVVADVNKCLSYSSSSIKLKDGNGVTQNVTIAPLGAPVFTAPATLGFSPGVSASKTISATGAPIPTVCFTSAALSALPSGFSATTQCGSGSVQLNFNGNSNLPVPGTFVMALTATNGVGLVVTQTVTGNINTQLAIISPAGFSATAGIPVTFLVQATGNPTPKISVSPGWLPDGLTLTDNGNGTATISGAVQTAIALQSCIIVGAGAGPCGILATNSQGTVAQQLGVNLTPAPTAHVAFPTSATFHTGAANQVIVSTTGNTTPITSWIFSRGTAGSWLNGTDNRDGTFTLSGTPPIGTSGVFTPFLTPFAQGANGDGSDYTLNVVDLPFFRNRDTATVTVGISQPFSILTTQGLPTLALGQTLPSGLSLLSSPPTAVVVTGTAAPGTGGSYQLTFIANAVGKGSTQQVFNLYVNEGSQFISPNTATFTAGTPGTFAVNTTGYPSNSTFAVGANSQPPISPAEGKGTYFTISGLPGGLTATNLNSQGFATGRLIIQGSASAAGSYPVTITARNGVGVIAQQVLTLNVVKPQYMLSVNASPAGVGTVNYSGKSCSTSCSAGYTGGDQVVLTATPANGYAFSNWTGACSGTGACSLTMDASKSITALFAPTLNTTLGAALGVKSGPGNARVWPVVFTNSGPGDAASIVVTGFTLTQTSGTACSPVVQTPIPINAGSAIAASTVTANVTIDFTSCAFAARFRLTMPYAANNSSISNTLTVNNQFQ